MYMEGRRAEGDSGKNFNKSLSLDFQINRFLLGRNKRKVDRGDLMKTSRIG